MYIDNAGDRYVVKEAVLAETEDGEVFVGVGDVGALGEQSE